MNKLLMTFLSLSIFRMESNLNLDFKEPTKKIISLSCYPDICIEEDQVNEENFDSINIDSPYSLYGNITINCWKKTINITSFESNLLFFNLLISFNDCTVFFQNKTIICASNISMNAENSQIYFDDLEFTFQNNMYIGEETELIVDYDFIDFLISLTNSQLVLMGNKSDIQYVNIILNYIQALTILIQNYRQITQNDYPLITLQNQTDRFLNILIFNANISRNLFCIRNNEFQSLQIQNLIITKSKMKSFFFLQNNTIYSIFLKKLILNAASFFKSFIEIKDQSTRFFSANKIIIKNSFLGTIFKFQLFYQEDQFLEYQFKNLIILKNEYTSFLDLKCIIIQKQKIQLINVLAIINALFFNSNMMITFDLFYYIYISKIKLSQFQPFQMNRIILNFKSRLFIKFLILQIPLQIVSLKEQNEFFLLSRFLIYNCLIDPNKPETKFFFMIYGKGFLSFHCKSVIVYHQSYLLTEGITFFQSQLKGSTNIQNLFILSNSKISNNQMDTSTLIIYSIPQKSIYFDKIIIYQINQLYFISLNMGIKFYIGFLLLFNSQLNSLANGNFVLNNLTMRNIKLKNSFFSNNILTTNAKFLSLQSFLLSDSIIKSSAATSAFDFNSLQSLIKDVKIQRSTFMNEQQAIKIFLNINSSLIILMNFQIQKVNSTYYQYFQITGEDVVFAKLIISSCSNQKNEKYQMIVQIISFLVNSILRFTEFQFQLNDIESQSFLIKINSNQNIKSLSYLKDLLINSFNPVLKYFEINNDYIQLINFFRFQHLRKSISNVEIFYINSDYIFIFNCIIISGTFQINLQSILTTIKNVQICKQNNSFSQTFSIDGEIVKLQNITIHYSIYFISSIYSLNIYKLLFMQNLIFKNLQLINSVLIDFACQNLNIQNQTILIINELILQFIQSKLSFNSLLQCDRCQKIIFKSSFFAGIYIYCYQIDIELQSKFIQLQDSYILIIQIQFSKISTLIENLFQFLNVNANFNNLIFSLNNRQIFSINNSNISVKSSIFIRNIDNVTKNGTIFNLLNCNFQMTQSLFIENKNQGFGGNIYFKGISSNSLFAIDRKNKMIKNQAYLGGSLALIFDQYIFVPQVIFQTNIANINQFQDFIQNSFYYITFLVEERKQEFFQLHPVKCILQKEYKIIPITNLIKSKLYYLEIRFFIEIQNFTMRNENVSLEYNLEFIYNNSKLKKKQFYKSLSSIEIINKQSSNLSLLYQELIIFSSNLNMLVRNCIDGEYIYNDECFNCQEGFYSIKNNSQLCSECPLTKAFCSKGVIVQLLPGYWRKNTKDDVIVECSNYKENCINRCRKGLICPLCEICDQFAIQEEYYYFEIKKYQCQTCELFKSNFIFIILSFCTKLLFIFMLNFLTLKGLYKYIVVLYLNYSGIYILGKSGLVQLPGSFAKFFMSYLQLVYAQQTSALFQFNLAKKISKEFANLLEIGLSVKTSSYQCTYHKFINYNYLDLWQSFEIINLILIILIIIIALNSISACYNKINSKFSIIIFSILYLYKDMLPQITQQNVKSLNCRKIGQDFYNLSNQCLPCYDNFQLKAIFYYFLPLLIFFLVVLPFWIVRNLLKVYKAQIKFPSQIIKYGYLNIDLNGTSYYYEVLRIIQNSFFVAISVVFAYQTLIRVQIQQANIVIYFIITLRISPFITSEQLNCSRIYFSSLLTSLIVLGIMVSNEEIRSVYYVSMILYMIIHSITFLFLGSMTFKYQLVKISNLIGYIFPNLYGKYILRYLLLTQIYYQRNKQKTSVFTIIRRMKHANQRVLKMLHKKKKTTLKEVSELL